jgi:hypothetical protein
MDEPVNAYVRAFILEVSHTLIDVLVVNMTLLPGGRPRDEKIRLQTRKGGDVTPAEYERLGGHGHAKKWRKSVRIVQEDGSTGIALGDHLAGRLLTSRRRSAPI